MQQRESVNWVQRYEQLRPHYQEFCDRLKKLLEDLMKPHEDDVHVIEARAKDIESFERKITRPDKQYKDPLKDVTDLAGLRIILYDTSGIEQTLGILRDEFVVVKKYTVDRRTQLQPNEFGYLSVHYVVRLGPKRESRPAWTSYSGFVAEIQVRTVLQHAWASLSHAIDYKRKTDAPTLLRRKLFLLAGLLEIADEQFHELRLKDAELRNTIELELEKEELDVEVNSVSLAGYLQKSVRVEQLARTAERIGFLNVDSDRRQSHISQISAICALADVRKVHELESILDADPKWNIDYFTALLRDGAPWRANPAFIVLLVVIGSFHDHVDIGFLEEAGWAHDIAEKVITIAESMRNRQK